MILTFLLKITPSFDFAFVRGWVDTITGSLNLSAKCSVISTSLLNWSIGSIFSSRCALTTKNTHFFFSSFSKIFEFWITFM